MGASLLVPILNKDRLDTMGHDFLSLHAQKAADEGYVPLTEWSMDDLGPDLPRLVPKCDWCVVGVPG